MDKYQLNDFNKGRIVAFDSIGMSGRKIGRKIGFSKLLLASF